MSDPRFLPEGFDKCLFHFIEECGEAIAAAGKLQRYGPDSANPLLPKHQQETNLVRLLKEMNDVVEAAQRLNKVIPPEVKPPKHEVLITPSLLRTYLVFAPTHTMAIEWAINNNVHDWIYGANIRRVKASFANRDSSHFKIYVIENGWGEDPQVKEALEYAQGVLNVVNI